jgi:protein O-mannosyl-transferase
MMESFVTYKKWLILGAICVLTFMCFRYTLNNQFTNWDDDFYVTNDPYIKALTPENLKVIFTKDITKNNYHPLCMLSLAINYHFAQLNPGTFYLTNILIHVANVILVFFLMMQLCVRLKMSENNGLFVASFGALWFGIHPMHVESVAWIAERKDVLYCFFYLWGLLAYLRFLKTNKTAWYWITFLLFVASCLSKPMAVVFPLSLLCIDVLLQRKLDKKLLTEKIVFFLFSLIIGAAAFYTQNKTGAVAKFSTLSLAERVMYASYGFVMYVWKIFSPTYLSTFYPYPYRYVSGYLPGIYYAAPFLAIAIIAVPIYLAYKYKREYFPIVAFGIGFFVVNVMFVLQFISVGAAIMADRYSYVAYIGLFFLLAWLVQELVRKHASIKNAVIVALLLVSSWLAYTCYERTYVWHDAETLLSDAIEKYPYRALLSYKWLGNYYFDKGDLDKALENYNVLVTLRAADAKIYDNVGRIYNLKKDYKSAVSAFNNSQQEQGDVYKTYLDRSITYSSTGDSLNAFKDYVNAYRLNPLSERILADTAFSFVQSQRFDAAHNIYNILLKLNPNNAFYYFYRGVSEFSKGNMTPAIADWEIGVKMNSKDVQQSASYNLSVAYDSLGKDSLALYYALMAKRLGSNVTDEFLAKLAQKRAKRTGKK